MSFWYFHSIQGNKHSIERNPLSPSPHHYYSLQCLCPSGQPSHRPLRPINWTPLGLKQCASGPRITAKDFQGEVLVISVHDTLAWIRCPDKPQSPGWDKPDRRHNKSILLPLVGPKGLKSALRGHSSPPGRVCGCQSPCPQHY